MPEEQRTQDIEFIIQIISRTEIKQIYKQDAYRVIRVVERRASFRSSFSQLDGNDSSVLESDCPSTQSLEQREDDETIGVSRKESSDSPNDLELDDGGESLQSSRHPRPLERARLRFLTRTGKAPKGMRVRNETTTETGSASSRSLSLGRVRKNVANLFLKDLE